MPISLSCDFQLLDEWLLTTGVPVDSSSPQPVAMFINDQGQSEALVVHQDGELYHVCREPLSDSGWNMYGIGARLTLGVGVDCATACAVGLYDQGVWRLRLGKWQRLPALEALGGIGAGWDGTLWAAKSLGSSNSLSQYAAGAWQSIWQGQAPVSAIGGSADSVWVADILGNVFNVAGGQTTSSQLPGGATVTSFCVTRGGLILAATNGSVYQFANGQWSVYSAFPSANYSAIQVTTNGVLWAVLENPDGSVTLQYQDSNGNWDAVAGPPTGLAMASPNQDGSVFALDGNGAAWLLPQVGGVWQRQITPTGMHGITFAGSVTEVAVGQDGNGAWQAFYSQAGNVGHASLSGTQWNGGGGFVAGSTLGVIRDTGSNGVICYGVDGSGDFLVIRPDSNGNYAANSFQAQAPGFFAGAPVSLTAASESLWYTTTLVSDTLCFAVGPASNPLLNPYDPPGGAMWPVTDAQNPNIIRNNMKVLARLPWNPNANPYAAVLDYEGNVYLVTDMGVGVGEDIVVSAGTYNLLPAPVNGALPSPTPFSAVVDGSGMARLYATDNSSQLWVLRQLTGSGDPSQWTWGQWHPLGDACTFLANSPAALATGDLFAVDTSNVLYLLSQANGSLTWTAGSVRRPAGTGEDPDNVRVYKTEVTALDENGTQSPNTPLTVMPTDEAATLWIEGQQYTIQPGQPVTCSTNPLGKLRIFTPATGLHTPKFQVRDSTGASVLTVYPPQHIHDFMAGNAPMSGQTFTADGQTMANAVDSTGQPFTLAPDLATNPNLKLAATAITNIAARQPSSSSRGFILRPVSSAAPGAPDSPLDAWDDFWNDLCNYAEDFFQAIRNGILKVVNVVAQATEDAVQIIVQFAETAYRKTINFIVKTAEDIANALHTAFAWLEATVDKILDWLKALFDWKAIINTQEVFSYYVTQGFQWLQGEVVKGEQLAQKFFTNLQTEVDNDLDAIGAYLGDQSLSNAASSPATTSQVSWPSLPNAMPASVFLSGTQINWLIDKVEAAIFGSSSGIPPVPNLFNFGQACYSAADAGWANLKAAIDNFKDYVLNLVQQPADFQQLAVQDLLAAVKATIDAALEFADAIVQALLDLVGNALGYIDTLLNYAIDIPLVSYLFQEFTGQQLTAQNLFTMLAAAPVTIVYKLMGGGRYLFTDAQVQEITGGGQMVAAAPREDPALVTAFGFCAAGLNLVWAIFDTCLDAVQATPPVGLQLMDIIFPSLVQIFGWPGGVPMTAVPMNTPAEKWGFGNWVTGWSPIGLNIGLMLIGTFGTLEAQDARYIDGLGQGILTAIGLVNLGVGAAASALGQKDGSVDAYGVVANTLSPMSNLFQFLRIEALEEASEMLTYYIKLLLDFFCGAGTSVAMFVGAAGSSAAVAVI